MDKPIRVVAFLQNAWSPMYAGDIWPRESWLKALHRSRSGNRLKKLRDAATGVEFWFDNTTPQVGDNPDSVLPPDIKHIRRVLRAQKPDYVLTLGKQAGDSVAPLCKVPLLALPHPAYRVVTNALYIQAGEMLAGGKLLGMQSLRQERGETVLEPRVARVVVRVERGGKAALADIPFGAERCTPW